MAIAAHIRKLGLWFLLVGLGILFFYAQNQWFIVTHYNLNMQVDSISRATQVLDESLEHKLRIVHLSDLHSARFGKDQGRLIAKVSRLEPDLVVITGDLVDSKVVDFEAIATLVRGLKVYAPVYISFGNHEAWGLSDQERLTFQGQLEKDGATVLRNEWVLGPSDLPVVLGGLDDPTLTPWDQFEDLPDPIKDLKTFAPLSILLSHRPEKLQVYAQMGVDLVLSGHAHGGQVRLPFVGGLVAPDQGLFPTYDAGLFYRNKTAMIVNRGLGNSIIPLRLFNYPEIVCITIHY